jgi:hypothetical protein
VLAADVHLDVAARLIRLRYATTCAGCSAALVPGTRAWWDGESRTTRCVACGAMSEAQPARRAGTVAVDTAGPPAKARPGLAGGSAQREFERRKAKRDDAVRSRHPRIGGLILALTDEPPTTTNWAKGAEGERKLGAGLDGVAGPGVIVLHDRLRPGTTANIDHMVVTSSGVWVIDAKRYKGQVAKRDVGGWFASDARLYVGGRDCTGLLAGIGRQVDAVRSTLGANLADVPVRPVLCFVDAEWGWFASPFELNGVLVAWPKATRERLLAPGPYGHEAVQQMGARLDEGLRPAR